MGMLHSGIRSSGCTIGPGWTSMDSSRDKNILEYQHCSMLQSGVDIMVPALQRSINTAGCSVGTERAKLNS